MKWLKRIGILITWIAVLVGGTFALMSSQTLRNERPIISTQIEFIYPENQVFIIEEDLQEILGNFGAPWDSISRAEINIPLLEENLRNHPLVLGAEVFSTWEGVLHIQITQKEAKARVVNELGMMYVDAQGGLFPLAAHNSVVLPLVSGCKDSTDRREALELLASAANHDAFPGGWSAIAKDETGAFTVYPQWHAHSIRWGDASEFEQKAHKAHALYAELLQSRTLDSLDWLDVRYSGQVVYGFNN